MSDNLGSRMKSKYEDPFRFRIPQRTYTIIRIDGKSFHTYTQSFEKPYSSILSEAMDQAAVALAKSMMGGRLAYGQSDEFSFLMTDFESHETEMWFDGNVQKISSVASSIFTANFNDYMRYVDSMRTLPLAYFDCRVFTISSREEVLNYFIWRQQDAERNSLNMLASAHFSHTKLHGLSCADRHDLLHGIGVNWNDVETRHKRGRVIRKFDREKTVEFTHKKSGELKTALVKNQEWESDLEIPIFTQERDYLYSLIPVMD